MFPVVETATVIEVIFPVAERLMMVAMGFNPWKGFVPRLGYCPLRFRRVATVDVKDRTQND
jgi:hypothetical protein